MTLMVGQPNVLRLRFDAGTVYGSAGGYLHATGTADCAARQGGC